MRRNWKRLLGALLGGLSFCIVANAQTPITNGVNGREVDIPCGQTCLNVPFKVPHLKQAGDYLIKNIPFAPLDMTTGTEVTSLYQDDQYSQQIPIGFTVCFYGELFNTLVIGSNGLVTFDRSNQSPCENSYAITEPIPYRAPPSNQCRNDVAYIPRSSIMGVYTDLDPSAAGSPPDRSINYRMQGAAPFRQFVVNFYRVGVYTNQPCGERSPTTFQIVIHESTGIVDIHVENFNCVAQLESGPQGAIMGLQNWDQDRAVSPAGKNGTRWSATRESYRYIPSGSFSRFLTAGMYDLSGTRLAVGDTSTTEAGILDISFPTVCPTADETVYVLRTEFGACDNTSTTFTSFDTITVRRNSLLATAVVTPSACGAVGTGTATVSIPSAITGTFTYTLNPGNVTQTGNPVFNNLRSGDYTIEASNGAGCRSEIDIRIGTTGELGTTITGTPTSCNGAADGQITILAPNAVGAVTYTVTPVLGPSIPIVQNNGNFSSLPAGEYLVSVTDASGCEALDIPVSIQMGSRISFQASVVDAVCPGSYTGRVTITAGGRGPWRYAINAGPLRYSNVFDSLPADTHFFDVIDANGCRVAFEPVTIRNGPGLTGIATSIATSCPGRDNGSIIVTPGPGFTGPFEYRLGTNAFQSDSIFTGLPAGAYSVVFRNSTGCTSTPIAVNVQPGTALTGTITAAPITCNGADDGMLTVVPGNAFSPHTYAINAGTPQSSSVFTSLGAGTYSVVITDNSGCVSAPISASITEPTALAIAQPTVTNVSCAGAGDGSIRANVTGGSGAYTYSLDNSTWQTANVFTVTPGTYVLYVRDARNCTAQLNGITVTEPAVLTASNLPTTNATCGGDNDGLIVINASGGTAPYTYAVDGSGFQADNNIRVRPGTYDIHVRDANGCEFGINDITVGLTNNMVISAVTPAPICEGTSVQLQATGNGASYAWTGGATNDLVGFNTASPTASPDVTTTYTVTATLGQCSAAAAVTVQVLPAPVANAGQNAEICFGQDYQLRGLPDGMNRYEWAPARFLSDLTIQNPLVQQPDQSATYSLYVTDQNNCRSVEPASVTVNVTPPIQITVTPRDTVVSPGELIQLNASSISTSYEWTPAAGLSSATIPNPVATAPGAGTNITYEVVGRTAAGCEGRGSVTLKAYNGPEIYVANVFTPNGDGRNDFFTPFPVGMKQYNYFRVMNRWGQVIYSTTTLNAGWDGRFAGAEQPSGVYVWMVEGITNDDRRITKKGTVTLIR